MRNTLQHKKQNYYLFIFIGINIKIVEKLYLLSMAVWVFNFVGFGIVLGDLATKSSEVHALIAVVG